MEREQSTNPNHPNYQNSQNQETDQNHGQNYNFVDQNQFPPNQIGYQYFDQKLKRNKYFLFPNYHTYYNNMVNEMEELKNYQDKKWTEEEKSCYQAFLDTVISYIKSYIFPGKVMDDNDFQAVFNNYRVYQNPQGYAIYLKQKQFLQNMKNRALNKKKKPVETIEENKLKDKIKQKEPEKEKEIEFIRKPDPNFEIH